MDFSSIFGQNWPSGNIPDLDVAQSENESDSPELYNLFI